jgi:hypothetical protein
MHVPGVFAHPATVATPQRDILKKVSTWVIDSWGWIVDFRRTGFVETLV